MYVFVTTIAASIISGPDLYVKATTDKFIAPTPIPKDFHVPCFQLHPYIYNNAAALSAQLTCWLFQAAQFIRTCSYSILSLAYTAEIINYLIYGPDMRIKVDPNRATSPFTI